MRIFLGDSSGLNAAFRPKPSCAQGIAGRVAHSSVAYRNHEIEKSDSEPGGKTVHRVCPRGGQAIGETTATYLANRRQTTALRDSNQINVRCGISVGDDNGRASADVWSAPKADENSVALRDGEPERLGGGVKLDIGNPVALAPTQAGLFVLALEGCRRASEQRRLYVLKCVDADDGVEAAVDSARDHRHHATRAAHVKLCGLGAECVF